MKTQKIDNQIYTLGTAKEIGKYIEMQMALNQENIHFPDFSIAIAAEYYIHEQPTLEDIALCSEGWYGAHEFDAGFGNTEILTVCFDYYGGGCAHLIQLWKDELNDHGYTASPIATAILNTIGIQETVNENTIFIVEWDMKKYINPYVYFEDIQNGTVFQPVDTKDTIIKTEYLRVGDTEYNCYNITQQTFDFVADDHKIYVLKEAK